MALVLKDRVRETSTTTGTGTITLAGAVSGFQSFSNIGNGNTTYYTIAGGTEWEVGLGTYTSSGNTLSRDTVLESSNGGSLVNFSAGTKDVFVTYPAEKAVTLDNTLPVSSGGTGTSTAFTTGSVVFAGASGVYSQDNANFFWDDTNNRLGIGTSSPTAKLQVNGIAAINGGAAATDFALNLTGSTGVVGGVIAFNSGATISTALYSDSSGIGLIGTRSNHPLVFLTNATEKMRIDASGNVGIGNSNPSFPLSVNKNSAANNFLGVFANTDTGASSGAAITVTQGAVTIQMQSYGNSTGYFGTQTNHPLAIQTNSTERMRIDSSGNVGIGTTSPTQMLTVNGAVGYNAPITVTDATHTVATTTNWIIANRAGTVTLTLPAAASFTGRILTVKNVQAQTVISASSDVVPIGSTSAGTAILAATAGKFATIVSDGTNWIVMQAN